MPDRDTVLKGMEEISDYFFSVYRRSTDREEINKAKDRCDVAEDALALLKEQEAEIENLKQTCQSMMEGAYLLKERDAVEPSFKQDEKGIFVWCCGSCGTYMYHIYDGIDKAKEYAKFCRQCGRAVKWDA